MSIGGIWVSLAHCRKLPGICLGMISSEVRLFPRPRRNQTKPFPHPVTFGHGLYHKNREQPGHPPRLNNDLLIASSCVFWLDLWFFSKKYLINFAVRAPRMGSPWLTQTWLYVGMTASDLWHWGRFSPIGWDFTVTSVVMGFTCVWENLGFFRWNEWRFRGGVGHESCF